ncbi:primosomal protein DnaI [Halobacillus sp. ACCC02827]|uniref:primosomal protein DnaI n=1 Tax=Bacillaceae TaxID=186817 RepID=UPI0002A51FFB|nr:MULTISPECIES: primosomal protein DnaI [Bacillaceae]ELK47265.1 primosomal protein DnaI [Halobacillus sp. BAB-2008]QHT47380.1 primosomal protein DnaI [Bacillus sp. SB49]WJE14603.1 primosomal protein DnaI [Halobacillus sp. ACCC02827]
MEPIQKSLKKWMRNNKTFQDRMNKMKEEVLQSEDVRQLIEHHPELTEKSMEKNLIKLYEYQSQSKNCEKCPSREACINILPGYVPRVEVDGQEVKLAYDKCSRQRKREEHEQQKSLVRSLHMPREILEASLSRLDLQDPDRSAAVEQTVRYIESLSEELPSKGLYFHGPFGVGKTYFLGAIANELSEKHIPSMVIYMPEFVREMKASIKDDSINDKINAFKETPVLMLDDIGAESQSAWFRDEVLGSILHYRMMERLPVFFTSNYTIDELEKVLMTSNRGDVDQVKAKRITERIRQLSESVLVTGRNRRG